MTLQRRPCDQHPRSAAVTLTLHRGPAVLRRLTPRDRRRVLERLDALDSLERLARERPYTGAGWAA